MFSQIILGKNSVEEAIKSGRHIDKIFISKTARNLQKLLEAARGAEIVIKYVDPCKLNQYGKNSQGVVAMASPIKYAQVLDILDLAKSRGEPPFVVLCDGIEDPHDLGGLIRTAAAGRAQGLTLPKRRSASITPVVEKTSSAAVNSLLIAQVTNLPS